MIASKTQDSQIIDCGQVFNAIDLNGDGWLTMQELHEGFQHLNLHFNQTDLENVMKSIDLDKKGKVSYNCTDLNRIFGG